MKRSVLDLYLTKVSQGDNTYLDRLCTRLADRLLFVPLISNEGETKDSPQGQLPFLHIKGDAIRLVPAFTHENGLREWCKLKALNVSYASLLGYELCAALTRDIGLVINPSSENSVSLRSDAIDQIASYGKRPETVEPLGIPNYQHVHSKLPEEFLQDDNIEEIKEPQINVGDTVEIQQPILSAERPIITLYDVVEDPPSK